MSTVITKTISSRSEANKKAWETRRAKAAAYKEPVKAVAPVEKVVEKVVEMKKTEKVAKAEKVVTPKPAAEFILDALEGKYQIKKATNPEKQRFFVRQGDDARLKSLLLKIARGEANMSEVPKVTVEYVKKGQLRFIQNNPVIRAVFA